MNRRDFLKSAAAAPLLQAGCARWPKAPASRVRPGEPGWPSAASWERLSRQVGGRLIQVESPVAACREPGSAECGEFLRKLKNPYYIGGEPGLTQTSGWVDAWMSAPSVYAVAARNSEDVAAAVNFARENHLRLVVKGGGHSYKGTSCSADSLLIWTRAMNEVRLQEAFVARGCAGRQDPQPVVTLGSGAIWMEAYEAVTTRGGRYVQGGGCTTVGVAGLIQSGGFGSFSKHFGMAAAALLEAEIVTADGVTRIANACLNPDLFWALKGGGGGSFGVVTQVTLRTRELPEFFGGVFGTIRARSDTAFRKLIAETVRFYRQELFNPHWGEQIAFAPDNTLHLSMVFQGLDRPRAARVWEPFRQWVAASPQDFSFERELTVVDVPARNFWNAGFIEKAIPEAIVLDDRPGAPAGHFLWKGDQGQAGQVLHGYQSAWLPAALLAEEQQSRLAEALFASSRFWRVSLHFNKGLAGAPEAERAAARDTAIHPAALDAFALAIIAAGGPPAFPGIAGLAPDVPQARSHARAISRAMNELLRVAPAPGCYVSESDFFERSWQQAFWGPHYSRLAAVKAKYDPDGLFFVHHGVGIEGWSADGFARVGAD